MLHIRDEPANLLLGCVERGEPWSVMFGAESLARSGTLLKTLHALEAQSRLVLCFDEPLPSPAEMHTILAANLGIAKLSSENPSALVDLLVARHAAGAPAAVIAVNRCEELTQSGLLYLWSLHALSWMRRPALQIILVGHPRFWKLLEAPGMERVAESLGARYWAELQASGPAAPSDLPAADDTAVATGQVAPEPGPAASVADGAPQAAVVEAAALDAAGPVEVAARDTPASPPEAGRVPEAGRMPEPMSGPAAPVGESPGVAEEPRRPPVAAEADPTETLPTAPPPHADGLMVSQLLAPGPAAGASPPVARNEAPTVPARPDSPAPTPDTPQVGFSPAGLRGAEAPAAELQVAELQVAELQAAELPAAATPTAELPAAEPLVAEHAAAEAEPAPDEMPVRAPVVENRRLRAVPDFWPPSPPAQGRQNDAEPEPRQVPDSVDRPTAPPADFGIGRTSGPHPVLISDEAQPVPDQREPHAKPILAEVPATAPHDGDQPRAAEAAPGPMPPHLLFAPAPATRSIGDPARRGPRTRGRGRRGRAVPLIAAACLVAGAVVAAKVLVPGPPSPLPSPATQPRAVILAGNSGPARSPAAAPAAHAAPATPSRLPPPSATLSSVRLAPAVPPRPVASAAPKSATAATPQPTPGATAAAGTQPPPRSVAALPVAPLPATPARPAIVAGATVVATTPPGGTRRVPEISSAKPSPPASIASAAGPAAQTQAPVQPSHPTAVASAGRTAVDGAQAQPSVGAVPPATSLAAPAASVPVVSDETLPRVLLHVGPGPRSKARGDAAAEALRQAGYVESEEVQVSPGRPGVSFFFLQDQESAASVGRLLAPTLGDLSVGALTPRGEPPPPGTVEVTVPDH